MRRPDILLDCVSTGPMKERSLLLVGNNYESLQSKYADSKNIVFTGPIPHIAIQPFLSKARFGINFIIDREPLNQQTSTKFLEYAACGLPVISTRYRWIEKFQQQYGGNYFYLLPDLSNFTWENVNAFEYHRPDLSQWNWEHQIRRSGVLEFLKSKFEDLKMV